MNRPERPGLHAKVLKKGHPFQVRIAQAHAELARLAVGVCVEVHQAAIRRPRVPVLVGLR